MKYALLGAFILVVGIGAVGAVMNQPTEVMNERVEVNTLEVEVAPDWATDEDAVKAAQDVIQRKEWQAELDELREERASVDARITELEKNLGQY